MHASVWLADDKILTIRAEDVDAGNNGSVKFRLVDSSTQPANYPDGQYYPYFAVDENGVVSTLATFDREIEDQYTFQVVAYDQGTPEAKSGETGGSGLKYVIVSCCNYQL